MKYTLNMKPELPFTFTFTFTTTLTTPNPIYYSLLNSPKNYPLFFKIHTLTPLFYPSSKYPSLIKALNNPNHITPNEPFNELQFLEIKNPNLPNFASRGFKFTSTDQAFFLFTFIVFSTSAAFVGFVAAAVPTLFAMRRAANSFAKLADAAREELPSTMAAVRLSGMEVSDLTLELTDLSQEVSEGVNKSAQAVEAAKVGIQQIGARTRDQTISMIEERANLPEISLQTAVSNVAKKTCRAAGRAARAFLDFISGDESNSEEIG